jgi:hypothetical protein
MRLTLNQESRMPGITWRAGMQCKLSAIQGNPSVGSYKRRLTRNAREDTPRQTAWPDEEAQIDLAASCNALMNAFLAAPYSLLVAAGHAELMTMINRSSLNVVIDWPKMPTAS